jgi:hypothetical protein
MLMAVWIGCTVMATSAKPAIGWAQAEEDGAASELDDEASTPAGAQHVTQRLMQEFGVEEARITGLREQNLGYGEIHHALTLARQMPGGITDENVNTIMQMRQEQHMGWGQISQELGWKLGQVTAPADAASGQSLVRPGSARGAEEKAKGRGWFGLGRGAGGIERPGGGKAKGLQGGSTPATGLGRGGGISDGKGKSSLAPGHNR